MNSQLRDNARKLENVKSGKKMKKKKRNLVVSKPENHNLSCKTAIKITLKQRKEEAFFFAATKLKVDQIKSKMEAKFNKPLYILKLNIQSELFWIVTVQDWFKTSSANALCPLNRHNFSNVLDIDILLEIKSKINAAFLIINERSTRNGSGSRNSTFLSLQRFC